MQKSKAAGTAVGVGVALAALAGPALGASSTGNVSARPLYSPPPGVSYPTACPTETPSPITCSSTPTVTTTPTPIVTPAPTATPTPFPLRIGARPASILRGQVSVVSVRALPEEKVDLFAYTLPNHEYRLVRSGNADATGLISWPVRPGADTRLRAQGTSSTASPSLVVKVRQPATRVSLDIGYDQSEGAYFMSGSTVPCHEGAAVQIYRLLKNGTRQPAARLVTHCTAYPGGPQYQTYFSFTHAGTYTFQASVRGNADAPAGQSPRVTIAVPQSNIAREGGPFSLG